MTYTVHIDADALQDIRNAALWYEEQSKGLGKRYKAQIIKQINELRNNPLVIAIRYANIRCMKIKKFPFLVHFTVENNIITVYAVFHTSRNPEIWKRNVL